MPESFLVSAFLWAVVWAAIGAAVGQKARGQAGAGGLACLLLGPLGLFVIALLDDKRRAWKRKPITSGRLEAWPNNDDPLPSMRPDD